MMDRSLELGYVGVEVSDPAALDNYLTNILGLVPGAPTTDNAPTYRLDARAQRLIVHNGPKDDVSYTGFVAHDTATFDAVVGRLEHAGYPVTPSTDEEKTARRAQNMAYTVAPWGTRIEIAHGPQDAPTPFESQLVPGGFVTSEFGLGHAVFMIPGSKDDHDAAGHFVIDGLGMQLSDYMEIEMGGATVSGNFYHCNGRHHSLALIFVPSPVVSKTLDHVMIETVSEDNVGHAYDRAVAAGVPIARDLGKHPNDQMFSFYSVSPAGVQFEFGAGAVVVDDGWEVVRYDRVSAWGHHDRTEGSVSAEAHA